VGRVAAKTVAASPASTGKGDIARAMFARWDETHRDPKPVSWEKLQATLEENRLREASLFAE
jgi:hypothetical protein